MFGLPLGIISTLVGTFSSLVQWFTRWNMKREAKREAEADLVIAEQEVNREVGGILAEHRDDASTLDRLRTGTF